MTFHVQRFCSKESYGSFIDVSSSSEGAKGFAGWGMVHHIALWMENWDACDVAFSKIKESKKGIICRVKPNQFSSLYFREGDALLFELLDKMPAASYPERIDDALVKVTALKKS